MKQRKPPLTRALLIALAGTLALVSIPSSAQNPPVARAAAPRAPHWHKVSVTLPVSTALFPAGEGADIASSQCLICHSAGMVLSQPARTEAQWKDTINKMRNVYGAPLPAEQVDALAAYFARSVGHDERGQDASQTNW